jgi:hypothetical protein
VAGGKLRHNSQEMYLSDEDREKLRKLENERYGFVFRGRAVPNKDK